MTEKRSKDRDTNAIREEVIAAALQYRDAMRAYLAGQVAAVEQGATLDELVRHNQAGFQNAAQAEVLLFELLDRLERLRASNKVVLRKQEQRL